MTYIGSTLTHVHLQILGDVVKINIGTCDRQLTQYTWVHNHVNKKLLHLVNMRTLTWVQQCVRVRKQNTF